MKKILIVEDNSSSAFLLNEILDSSEYHLTTVTNGKAALFEVQGTQFDIIITDWMMPIMDGIELIRKIRVLIKSPPVIILVTAISSPEARQYAFEAGADEFITKPIEIDLLLARIKECVARKEQIVFKPSAPVIRKNTITKTPYIAVCIGAGTGGPNAIRDVIKNLEHTAPAVFFIVMHGPKWILDTFQQLLQKDTDLKVSYASDDNIPEPGNIYIAEYNKHLVINQSFKIKQDMSPPVNFVRPSVDVLFSSASANFGKNCIGVVLTGMGCDGALGAEDISDKEGLVLVQEPATCVVSSMPENVIKLGIAKEVLPLGKMGKIISYYIQQLWARK